MLSHVLILGISFESKLVDEWANVDVVVLIHLEGTIAGRDCRGLGHWGVRVWGGGCRCGTGSGKGDVMRGAISCEWVGTETEG